MKNKILHFIRNVINVIAVGKYKSKLDKVDWKRLYAVLEKTDNWWHGNNKKKNVTIGKFSYVSYNSIAYYCNIGNYCSIGPNVVIGYGNHPTNQISTSPHVYFNEMYYSPEEKNKILEKQFELVEIEHDVWIGANVYIMNGVTIGTGAVIGAGAVVTKNVEPYSIVVGVPAKEIKKRFSASICELLLKSKWWECDESALKDHLKMLKNPTEDAISAFIQSKNKS